MAKIYQKKSVYEATQERLAYIFSEFENIVVKGMKDYDTYLTIVYGDYMMLPRKEDRNNHGIKAWRIENYEE